MKDIFADFSQDDLWLIEEPRWVRHLQNIRESQFTLGNGYLGIRGVLEEIPYDAMAGTYVAGVYDKMGSQVDELVNLPNPVNFRFTIAGEKLDLIATDILEHQRILNMKKGLLIRHTVYQDTKKRRYDYQSLRFVSQHDRNIGAMQIVITALDAACSIDVDTGIDTSVSNAGILSEGRKRHFRVKELGQAHQAGYLVAETVERRHTLVYWSGFYYQINGKKTYAQDNIFRLRLGKGQTVTFTKIFYIKHFPCKEASTSYKKESFARFNQAFRGKFYLLLRNHIKAWERLWKKADIVVDASRNLQENLRFNIYHMLITAHYDSGFSSIGARTLSGEGYRGHIFWDAEIFLLPFYLFNFPRAAKNMLLYRCKRLNQSRELAQKEGYRGAKFAWESAGTGEEETPQWSKDLDNTVIKIHTHQQEHHITADIAYAVYKYYLVTADEEFMRYYGYELFFETARFWASRVKYNKKRKKYEVNYVIGPDEFHREVNNNAFTNMMAKWNLLTAHKLFYQLKKQGSLYKTLLSKLNLSEKEVKDWKKISAGIAINVNKNKIIEQFDGYFKLKEVSLTRTDENGIPLIPIKLKPRMLGKTRLVKQADVLMLLCLLDDVFNLDTKIANYDFYIKRTVHKSSLSPAIHALLACEVGDLTRAYNLFKVSLRADIANVYGNTYEGIHGASLGGTWQAVIFGFCGVKIIKEKIALNPHLPRAWNKIAFSLFWQQSIIALELTNDSIRLKVLSRTKKEMALTVFNRPVCLKTNKNYLFRRSKLAREKEGFY
ncbi:MAG: glycoside hydrolase family 65 protein [Candidatus Omnitrophica bacterium]|nr:glycoside hydrolase family 65 protein [Candidatus Omnitrophota bacterium]